MKIKIQSILASLLAVSLLTCSASAMTFPDVSKDSDYSTAVEYVSDLKIMVGDTQGNFNPNKIVTRAEMATIVCRVLGQAGIAVCSRHAYAAVVIFLWIEKVLCRIHYRFLPIADISSQCRT